MMRAATCERCGSAAREIQESCAAGATVCLCCHLLASASEDDGRIARQRAIATGIRGAIPEVADPRVRRKLGECALLIELAETSDGVTGLLGEVERLGIEVDR